MNWGDGRRLVKVLVLLVCGFWVLNLAAFHEDHSSIKSAEPQQGVLILDVSESGAAWSAGLRSGDLIYSWRPAQMTANGNSDWRPFDDPWDWTWVIVEWATRGDLKLSGLKDGELTTWTLPGGTEWGVLRYLPPLPKGFQTEMAKALEKTVWENEWRELLKKADKIDEQTRLWLLTSVAGSMGREMPEPWREALVNETQNLSPDMTHGRLLIASSMEVARAFQGASDLNTLGARESENNMQKAWHLHQNGVLAYGSGDLETALKVWQEAFTIREELAPNSLVFADSLHNMAAMANLGSDLDKAEELHQRALALREKLAPGNPVIAKSWYSLALIARNRGDIEEAEKRGLHALDIQKKAAPDSADTATFLNLLGTLKYAIGDLKGAMARFQETLEINERRAPDSLEVAATLNNLGVMAEIMGDFEAAIAYQTRALKIKNRIAPGGKDVAASLHNLGAVAFARGDLAQAQDYMNQAMTIYDKLGLKGLDVASSLSNLGAIAWMRGDLITAEEFYLRAQEIRERLAPESLEVSSGLNNLGLVAKDRGDLETAKTLFEKTLAIENKLAPNSLQISGTLSNLGEMAAMAGENEVAKKYFLEALALQEELAPGGGEPAISLGNLGQVSLDEGNYSAASRYLQRALKIREKLAPGGIQVAGNLYNLARLALLQEQKAAAETGFTKALDIYRQLAPGSDGQAMSAHALGMLLVRLDRKQEALALLEEAVSALESQVARLGGSTELQESFAASRHDYYFDLMALLVELGRQEQAFGIFERSRARSFRQLLASRDLVFTADLPETLDRERRALALRYDETMGALGQVTEEANPEEFAGLHQQLKDIRGSFDKVRAEITKTSPRFSALAFPQALDLKGAQDSLPNGTLALAYAVGEQNTLLFILGPEAGSFRVEKLALGRISLGENVTQVREALAERKSAGDLLESLAVHLLKPVGMEISESEKVLIIPDGPLHLLPWAVLHEIPLDGGDPVLLPPIHSAPSMTVYRDLASGSGNATGQHQIQAFADPKYRKPLVEEKVTAATGVRAMFNQRSALLPLPGTRREVRRISALFPDRIQLHLGPDASEAQVKVLPKETTILHIAVHGFVDPDHPLDSALAFSTPNHQESEKTEAGKTENGFLQVWEIFEQVRLPNTDLVVLSACDTALGKELGGEGIVGLGRAFQYAGASSVIVSLWKISDASTALFMEHFYKHLAAGEDKDVALYKAQRALAERSSKKTGSYSDPFYWAPFVLLGRPN